MKRLALAILLLISAVACKEKSALQTNNDYTAHSSQLQSILSLSRPAQPKSVKDAANPKPAPGSSIVVTGRVGGTKKPIGDFACLTLVQGDMPNCREEGGMPNCPTYWDLCCSDLRDKICTIQVMKDGKLLRATLRGLGGLKEMSSITVSGKVSTAENGVLVIDAEQIFIDKP
jgi:hypothetical protein